MNLKIFIKHVDECKNVDIEFFDECVFEINQDLQTLLLYQRLLVVKICIFDPINMGFDCFSNDDTMYLHISY